MYHNSPIIKTENKVLEDEHVRNLWHLWTQLIKTCVIGSSWIYVNSISWGTYMSLHRTCGSVQEIWAVHRPPTNARRSIDTFTLTIIHIRTAVTYDGATTEDTKYENNIFQGMCILRTVKRMLLVVITAECHLLWSPLRWRSFHTLRQWKLLQLHSQRILRHIILDIHVNATLRTTHAAPGQTALNLLRCGSCLQAMTMGHDSSE